jgi:hypothetical protein
VNYDVQVHRIRCIGHVINLALHAFLLANSQEALESIISAVDNSTSDDMEISLLLQLEKSSVLSPHSGNKAPAPVTVADQTQETASDSQAPTGRSKKGKGPKGKGSSSSAQTEDRSDRGWGGIPTLRKLHSIAVLLRKSTILYQSWMSDIGVALGIDNATRWNSWFHVIDVALRYRRAIVIWLTENSQQLEGNELDRDDWDMLEKTHEFLQPFKQGTYLTEKKLSTLSDAMNVLDILFIHCRKTRVIKASN